MKYTEKLLDPRWQKKRLQILERDDFTCQLCGDKDTTLHVHHLKYSKEPWDVDVSQLKCLCKHCHASSELVKKIFQISDIQKSNKHKIDGDNMFVNMLVQVPAKLSPHLMIFLYDNKSNTSSHVGGVRAEELLDITKTVLKNKKMPNG